MKLLQKAATAAGPLSDDAKRRIRTYLLWPTVEGWEDIHSLVIRWGAIGYTVWQAVSLLDTKYADIAVQYHLGKKPKNPKLRWHRIPDAVTVARAIKRVLDK